MEDVVFVIHACGVVLFIHRLSVVSEMRTTSRMWMRRFNKGIQRIDTTNFLGNVALSAIRPDRAPLLPLTSHQYVFRNLHALHN